MVCRISAICRLKLVFNCLLHLVKVLLISVWRAIMLLLIVCVGFFSISFMICLQSCFCIDSCSSYCCFNDGVV